MIPTNNFANELYPKPGHLFYAMAIADGTIEGADIKTKENGKGALATNG